VQKPKEMLNSVTQLNKIKITSYLMEHRKPFRF